MIINFDKNSGNSALVRAYQGRMDDTIDENTGVITPGTTGHKALCYIYRLESGKYSLVKIDIEDLIDEKDFRDGLLVSGHSVYVKINENSQENLTVSMSGVSLNGVERVVELTQAQYNALSAYAPYTTYVITDAEEINMDDYWTSAQTMSAITSAVSAETVARIEADSALTIAINNEVQRATSAETILQSAITKEIQDRIDAVSAETVARIAKDNELELLISGVSSGLATEIQNRISGDSALTIAINEEKDRAVSAETMILSALSAETQNRIDADSAITVALNQEIQDRKDDVDAEEERAISAETIIASAVSAETQARIAADAAESARCESVYEKIGVASGLVASESARSETEYFKKVDMSAYTPTSGFTTINGSAITNGGNMVISAKTASVSSTGGSINVVSAETAGIVNYDLEANVDGTTVAKSADGKLTTKLDLCYVDLYDSTQEIHIADKNGNALGVGVVMPKWSEWFTSIVESANTVASGLVASESARSESAYVKSAWTESKYEHIGVASGLVASESARSETEYFKKAAISAYTKTVDFATINNSAITEGGNLVIEGKVYSAGTYIDIDTNNVISVTGMTEYVDSAVTIEKNRAISAETIISSAVSAETQARIAADAAESARCESVYEKIGVASGLVETEKNRAISAETAIQSAVTKEVQDRIDAVSAETVARIAADAAESARTDSAITAAIGAESARTEAAYEKIGVASGLVASESARCETVYQKKMSGSTNIEVSANTISLKNMAKMNGNATGLTSSANTFYAPVSAGTANAPLYSNGSGAPIWGTYKHQYMTQAAYEALATKDNNTIYFIIG